MISPAALTTPHIAPLFSLWIMIPAFIVMAVLCARLYYDQRRVARHSTVLWLMFFRLALLALVLILFLQPSLQWRHDRATSGTLWIVLDQSPSMLTPDPQALAGERLRWAEGLGFLKRTDRDNRSDVLAVQVRGLAGDFLALEPPTATQSGGERRSINDYVKAINAWADALDTTIGRVNRVSPHLDGLIRNYKGSNSGAGWYAHDQLRFAGDMARADAAAAGTKSTTSAAAGAVRKYAIGRAMLEAQRALEATIARDDADYLRAESGNADITAGVARVRDVPRQDLAYGFLAGDGAPAARILSELAEKYKLRVAGFSDRAQAAGIGGSIDASAIPSAIKSALASSGQGTNLEAALRYVSEQIAGDEAASVVIVSDGRNNLPGDATAPARNLAARGVRVYGLLVGSHEVSPDAAVEQIDNAPTWIFKGDSIKPRALVRLDGLEGKMANVELLRDGSQVGRASIIARSNHHMEPVEFSDKPPESALAVEYQVRVSEVAGEVNTQNNVMSFRVAVKKDKLYALIIEDRPRWEYRYLATEFSRDNRLKVQTVLLSPVVIGAPPDPIRASPDNPLLEAQLLPETLAQWQAFDIIILGDIGPGVLSVPAQQAIAAAVRDKGLTLITIAGQRSMPGKFAESPLAEILPVTLDAQWTPELIARHALTGFRPAVGPLASTSVMAQLDVDPSGNAGLWSRAPLWYWHSPYTQVKPAATALWTIEELRPSAPDAGTGAGSVIAAANRKALLASMTVGLGRSLYLASDQTWRLRQVGGVDAHERFWGQVLRWAVGSDLPAGGKFVRFGANQPSYTQDQPATITARILKEDLTPYTGLSFSAVARAVQKGPATQGAGETASRETVEAKFTPLDSAGYYTATLGGLPTGEIEISLKGAEVERLLDSDPTVTQRTLLVRVDPTMNTERRNMNTDVEFLDTVTRAGAGYSVDAQYADLLLSRLPSIEKREVIITQLGFFTDPNAYGTRLAHWTFLGVFALLLTAEWLIRKRAGLV